MDHKTKMIDQWILTTDVWSRRPDPDGNSVHYTYDPVGSVTSARRMHTDTTGVIDLALHAGPLAHRAHQKPPARPEERIR